MSGNKSEKNKKFNPININNFYQGVTNQSNKSSVVRNVGLQPLGKVGINRRFPTTQQQEQQPKQNVSQQEKQQKQGHEQQQLQEQLQVKLKLSKPESNDNYNNNDQLSTDGKPQRSSPSIANNNILSIGASSSSTENREEEPEMTNSIQKLVKESDISIIDKSSASCNSKPLAIMVSSKNSQKPRLAATQKPIVTDKELENLDNITRQTKWASGRITIDYDAKLNFSDDDDDQQEQAPGPELQAELKAKLESPKHVQVGIINSPDPMQKPHLDLVSEPQQSTSNSLSKQPEPPKEPILPVTDENKTVEQSNQLLEVQQKPTVAAVQPQSQPLLRPQLKPNIQSQRTSHQHQQQQQPITAPYRSHGQERYRFNNRDTHLNHASLDRDSHHNQQQQQQQQQSSVNKQLHHQSSNATPQMHLNHAHHNAPSSMMDRERNTRFNARDNHTHTHQLAHRGSHHNNQHHQHHQQQSNNNHFMPHNNNNNNNNHHQHHHNRTPRNDSPPFLNHRHHISQPDNGNNNQLMQHNNSSNNNINNSNRQQRQPQQKFNNNNQMRLGQHQNINRDDLRQQQQQQQQQHRSIGDNVVDQQSRNNNDKYRPVISRVFYRSDIKRTSGGKLGDNFNNKN